MKHYTKEELELYRHGQMSVLGRIACSSHLKECEYDDAFVRELRDSIKTYKEAADGRKPLKQE